MKRILLVPLLLLALIGPTALPVASQAQEAPDFSVSGGHFYTQGTGIPAGSRGFRITDDGGILFWSEFQRLGGLEVLGYPISQRFVLQGFVHQATQKAILQWQSGGNHVEFLNVFDLLHDAGKDDSLRAIRSTPRAADLSGREAGKTFRQIVSDRLALLSANPSMQARYYSVSSAIDPMLIYGLPTSSVEDMGDHFSVRLQRAVIQQWKVNTPWAAAGQTTVANGGEIATEFGLVPQIALEPVSANSLDTVDVPVPNDRFADLAPEVKSSVVRVVVPGSGFGSGFVFDSSGLILTSQHVVERAVSVLVDIPDGRTVSGIVIGTDPLVDIAVIRVNATRLKALPLGDSEDVRAGDGVLAIGYTPSVANPPSARTGGVIDLIRPDRPVGGFRVSAIESDVFLHPGDSGGPLFNARGEVIGVNSSILYVPGNDTVVISQSVAINLAKLAIEQILARQVTQAGGVAHLLTSPLGNAAMVPVHQMEEH